MVISQNRISYIDSELEFFAYMDILDIRCIEISANYVSGDSPPQIVRNFCVCFSIKILIVQVWKFVTYRC